MHVRLTRNLDKDRGFVNCALAVIGQMLSDNSFVACAAQHVYVLVHPCVCRWPRIHAPHTRLRHHHLAISRVDAGPRHLVDRPHVPSRTRVRPIRSVSRPHSGGPLPHWDDPDDEPDDNEQIHRSPQS